MNPLLPIKVQKYLSKYAGTKRELRYNKNEKYDCAVVIPAIAEYKNLITLLDSLSENVFDKKHKVIVIPVINCVASSLPEIKEDNKKSILLLGAILGSDLSFDPVVEKFKTSSLSIGFVDASSYGFEMPEKTGGVGLARKIGMDLALTVFDYTTPEEKTLICLDADCTVENNYLNSIIDSFNKNKLNAAVINYEHPLSGDDEHIKAVICYEIFLRYYEMGIKYAASQYAFQTVGSAMACDYEAYIKIEGMNKQKAAEDFYFLEKLAKHYNINKINSTTVYPSGRKSWRVPFGTGQRVNRFLSGIQNEYLIYNPKSFSILKEWLRLFYSDKSFSGEDYLQKANDIHPELCNFLIEQNFDNDWNRILSNSKNDRQIQLQKQRWFDGFKTLKLIHHLRDTEFPLVNMFAALDILFKHFNLQTVKRNREIPELTVQKQYLLTLRNYLNNDNKNLT